MNTKANWTAFAAAPHRFFFFTGLFFMILMSGWWSAVVVARAWAGIELEPVLPGVLMHGSVMLYLVFPPFMFGFLLTVFPRWQPAPDIPKSFQALAFGLLHAAMPLILVGMYSMSEVLLTGWLMTACAWISIIGGLLWSRARASTTVVQGDVVLLALISGLVGILVLAWMMAFRDFRPWPWVKSIGIWSFLLPVYFSVSHRMIPFFTGCVIRSAESWRPDSLLRWFIAMAIARAMLEVTTYRWIPDVVMLAVAATLSWRWWPRQAHGNALLSVLHISFAWVVVALLLFSINDIAFATSGSAILGRAPLHALGMGFFGGMLIAMITRVTMGHSGRPLAMDRKGWWIFLLVQLAVGLRILAELLQDLSASLFVLAAIAWTGAFVAWAWRYGSIHFQPRADGRSG